MADGTVLKLVFETGYGQKTWSFKNANPSATTTAIKSAMETMITNGSIYKYPPLAKVKAELQTTTTTGIDVS